MNRKDPLQLFKFRFSKLSCICNFFLSLVITYIYLFLSGKNYGQFPTEGIRMNIIGMLMTVFSLMVIYLLKENNYRRLPKPEEREVEPQRFAMK